MGRRAIIFALIFLLMLNGLCETRVTAINVGKADAILLTINGESALVDTGRAYAYGRIRSTLAALGVEELKFALITHGDKDHIGGADARIGSNLSVGAWYISAFSDDNGMIPVQAGDTLSLGGATIDVLAPIEPFDNENDNSVVLMVNSADGKILLCGDIEEDAEEALLYSGADLTCDVIKVSHHGRADALTETLLMAADADVRLITTDWDNNPDIDGVITRDYRLGVSVTLAGGEATISEVPYTEPDQTNVYISALDRKNDILTLTNAGADADIGGWTVYSEKGEKAFVFPDGTWLAAGESLTLGSRETDADFVWDVKRAFGKKDQRVAVYNAFGDAVDETVSE